MKTKYIFYFFWLLLLVFPIFVVFKNTPNLQRTFSVDVLTLGFLQRITGLAALTLLPVQIIFGTQMGRLAEKWGGWVYTFHITQAILIYLLILSHPILFLIANKTNKFGFDPFYVFTDFCVVCKTNTELHRTLGRISFWLITIAYVVAKYRTHPMLQKHWRGIHILNYFTYFLIALHANFIGSDIHTKLYFWYFILSVSVVCGFIIYKLYGLFKSSN